MKKIMVGTVGLFLFTVGPVFPGSSTDFSDSQLQVRTYEGIPYVSGGFGMEERKNLRAMSKDDNLELSFALQNKNYLGGAEVLIKDHNGRRLSKRFPTVHCFLRNYRKECTPSRRQPWAKPWSRSPMYHPRGKRSSTSLGRNRRKIPRPISEKR
jgi:hypothetical protein